MVESATPNWNCETVLVLLSALAGTGTALVDKTIEHMAAATPSFDPGIAVRILCPIDDDPFPAANPGARSPAIVVELEGPEVIINGRQTIDALAEGIAPALPLSDRSRSSVICGWPQLLIDGRRSALRYLYLLMRREDFDHSEFIDYYFHRHAAYADHLLGISTYTQIHADAGCTERLAKRLGLRADPHDGVTALSFGSLDEFFAGVTPEAAEAALDEEHFVDRTRSASFCCSDQPIPSV
jgi:hypothetical protein